MEPTPGRKRSRGSPDHTIREIYLPHIQDTAIEAHSTLQRDFVHIAAVFPFTTKLLHKPFKLLLSDGAYLPNYLIVFQDGSRSAVEVGLERKIQIRKGRRKEIASALAQRGIQDVVATEQHFDSGQRADRARLVHRYAKSPLAAPERQKILDCVLASRNAAFVSALTQEGIARNSIMCLVGRHELETSSDIRTDDDSRVSIPETQTVEGSHAIRFANWLHG